MTFAEIDSARKSQGLSILELSARAGVAPSTYWFIREGKVTPKEATLQRYAEALAGARPVVGRYDAVRSTYRAHLAHAATQMGFDPAEVAERPDAREFWRVRAVALACVASDLDLRHAELARALGLSKQVVNWNIKQAVAMRGEPRLAWFVEASGRRADFALRGAEKRRAAP